MHSPSSVVEGELILAVSLAFQRDGGDGDVADRPAGDADQAVSPKLVLAVAC